MSPDLPDELDVFLVLHLAAAAGSSLVRHEFGEEGVDPGFWGLLVHIGARGRMRPSELATETGVSATTIRDQVQALVDRGLVERIDNADDGRSYFVALTADGERDLARGRAASARAEQRLADAYGETEPLRRELLRVISAAAETRRAGASRPSRPS